MSCGEFCILIFDENMFAMLYIFFVCDVCLWYWERN